MTHTRAIASHIADAVIEECCLNAACRGVVEAIVTAHMSKAKRGGHNQGRLALLPKHERKFAAMLRTMWGKQRRQVLANMRRHPKGYATWRGYWKKNRDGEITVISHKDRSLIDQWLYGKSDYVEQLSDDARTLLFAVLTEAAKNEIDHWSLDIEFDASAEWVTGWLDDYVFKFAQSLEDVSQDALRHALQEGIDAGESIADLAHRVEGVYDGWDEMRSELIARTETIRASNEGALDSYRQSGVVNQVIWITTDDDKTCPFCEDMSDTVIDLGETFWDEGDVYTIGEGDEAQSMTLDYSSIDGPPLHPDCRCTVAPYFEE